MLHAALFALALVALTPSAWAQDATAEKDAAVEAAPVPEKDDAAELIIVWPDKFARWKDTRWFVGAEVVLPTGTVFAREENKSFRSHAWQVRAVLACDPEHTLGSKRLEVGCVIEDIALQATSLDRFNKEKDKALVQEVLDSVDASLTGARLQLQVNDRGGIANIGLEGIETRNERERLRVETLRQVLARTIQPFHMRIPKSGMEEGTWVEFDSALMDVPSLYGSQGSSMIVHYLNFYRGWMLVQDLGEGMVLIPRPAQAQLSIGGGVDDSADEIGSADEAGGGGGNPDDPVAYKQEMTGVSIYNIENGIMEERVWRVIGTPTASTTNILKSWYSGRIQMLGESDTPDLGPTQQIGYPGMPIPGLPQWVTVDPELDQRLKAKPPGAPTPARVK